MRIFSEPKKKVFSGARSRQMSHIWLFSYISRYILLCGCVYMIMCTRFALRSTVVFHPIESMHFFLSPCSYFYMNTYSHLYLYFCENSTVPHVYLTSIQNSSSTRMNTMYCVDLSMYLFIYIVYKENKYIFMYGYRFDFALFSNQ